MPKFLVILTSLVTLTCLGWVVIQRFLPMKISLVLMMASLPGLWFVTEPIFKSYNPSSLVPPEIKFAVIALYLAGCLILLEMRSLLCRGISFRILIDLLQNKGEGDLQALESSYGDGMGLNGLLAKRLDTIFRMGLIQRREQEIGPLTGKGKILAWLTSTARNILTLKEVG